MYDVKPVSRAFRYRDRQTRFHYFELGSWISTTCAQKSQSSTKEIESGQTKHECGKGTWRNRTLSRLQMESAEESGRCEFNGSTRGRRKKRAIRMKQSCTGTLLRSAMRKVDNIEQQMACMNEDVSRERARQRVSEGNRQTRRREDNGENYRAQWALGGREGHGQGA
eukprot:3725756-Pleurochrysis_carterae.AAC.1